MDASSSDVVIIVIKGQMMTNLQFGSFLEFSKNANLRVAVMLKLWHYTIKTAVDKQTERKLEIINKNV